MRAPVSRMFQRTILACSSLNTPATCSADQTVSSAPSGEQVLLHLGLGGVDGGVAVLLVGDLVGGAQVGLDQTSSIVDFELREVGGCEVARVLGGDFGELDDRVDDRLEAARGRT